MHANDSTRESAPLPSLASALTAQIERDIFARRSPTRKITSGSTRHEDCCATFRVSAESPQTVMIVDDSAVCRQSLRYVLEGRGYRVVELGSPFGFGVTLNRERPDLVLLDVDMPAISGDQLVMIAHKHKLHRCPILLHSSCDPEKLARLARQSGAAGFVLKDGNVETLLDTVARFLRQDA